MAATACKIKSQNPNPNPKFEIPNPKSKGKSLGLAVRDFVLRFGIGVGIWVSAVDVYADAVTPKSDLIDSSAPVSSLRSRAKQKRM